MSARRQGDATIRDIIGPNGATDAHVTARLTAAVLPPGGKSTVELPGDGEDLFLYFVDGTGRLEAPNLSTAVDRYDVLLVAPTAAAPTIAAADQPLTYLSFYLPPFMHA
ncbi:MAG: hypothetical protein Fur0021_38810 [Candidatus Promineifilaceae bacterium]